jgi:UDP-N-acetylmuramate--alanine ligase
MDVLCPSSPQIVGASRPLRAHLVGIAGNGMRALADVLLGWGWTLSGSDLNTTGFSRPGPRLFHGHAAEHVPREAELVIYSDAIPAENPELRRAAELGIPALSYFQMLGQLGIGRRTVAIAGTHGKSTTAAMLAHLLIQAGRDPTVVYGATPIGATSGGRAGQAMLSPDPLHEEQRVRTSGGQRETTASNPQSPIPNPCASGSHPNPLPIREGPAVTGPAVDGQVMVVEACEYRANFLHLRPHAAAILNVEPDHFDYYDSPAQLEDAFRQFAQSLPSDGLLVIRHACERTRRVTAGLQCRVESFGTSADADWSAQTLDEDRGRFRFEIRRFGRPLCEVRLPLPGQHNVQNALAAAALALENGLAADQISLGLATFPGLHRRLEVSGDCRGATWVDDYAHHPTEVTAALRTVRQMFPQARLWCVFQPHQASRTARLLDELAASLQNADKVMVAEIFRAREGDPQPGEITAADLARRTAELGADVLPGGADHQIIETLETQLAAGDVLVTLGAGDVRKLRPQGRM